MYSPCCSGSRRRTSNNGRAMPKAKPAVLANVNQETRHVRDSLGKGVESMQALQSSAASAAVPSSPCIERALDDRRFLSAFRHYLSMKPVRILLIAPSLDILGGQSVQADRLLGCLAREPSLQVRFLPVNPRLPALFAALQRVKYLRTFITSVLCALKLIGASGRADVLHVFAAGDASFYLAPAPALLLAKLLRKTALTTTTAAWNSCWFDTACSCRSCVWPEL